ncbi:hypothetical protein ACFL1R_00030 [Candidatus Latescibacterota bacterium]
MGIISEMSNLWIKIQYPNAESELHVLYLIIKLSIDKKTEEYMRKYWKE